MKKILKGLLYLIKLTFLFICIINSCYVIYRNIYPDLPSHKVYKTDLKNIKFPLSFRICLKILANSSDRFKGRFRCECIITIKINFKIFIVKSIYVQSTETYLQGLKFISSCRETKTSTIKCFKNILRLTDI